MFDLVGNPEARFSRDKAQLTIEKEAARWNAQTIHDAYEKLLASIWMRDVYQTYCANKKKHCVYQTFGVYYKHLLLMISGGLCMSVWIFQY